MRPVDWELKVGKNRFMIVMIRVNGKKKKKHQITDYQ